MGREVLGHSQYQYSDIGYLLDNFDWQKEIKRRLKERRIGNPKEIWTIDENTLPVQNFALEDFNDQTSLKNTSSTQFSLSPDEIISKAKEEAYEEAEKIEQIAKKSSFEITERARWEARDIILKAREEAEKDIRRLKEEGKEEGHKEGFEKGRLEGFEKGKQEGNNTYIAEIKKWNSLIEELILQRKNLLLELKPILIELVGEALYRCLKEAAKNYKNLVIEFSEEVLKKAQDRVQFRLHVNPVDLEEVNKQKAYLMLSVGAKQIEILADARIEQGGCLLETEAGSIDARLSTVVDQVKQTLEFELNR